MDDNLANIFADANPSNIDIVQFFPPGETFFIAEAGQTADVLLMSGGGGDKILQAGPP